MENAFSNSKSVQRFPLSERLVRAVLAGLLILICTLQVNSVFAEAPWFKGKDFAHYSDCDSWGCDGAVEECDQLVSASGTWSVRADALFLFRESPDDNVLVVNTITPTESLNANSFDFGVQTGVDLAISRAIDSNTNIELRYFGLDHWDASSVTPTTPTQLIQVNAAIPIFTLAGTSISSDYRTDLHNGEINVSRQLGENFQLLAGFRYLELDERLSFGLDNAGIPLDYRVTTRNRLAGAQLGGIINLLQSGDHISLEAGGKAGIYGNAASQNGSVDTGVVHVLVANRDSKTSFVGEFNLLGKWSLTDHLAFRGGYNLLWLTDLALASDQLAVSNFGTGSGSTASSDSFYHGASVGLEIAW